MNQTVSRAAAPAAIGVYFLAWASVGVRMGFSYDDVTNLYFAWVRPLWQLFLNIITVWNPQPRPVGGLLYRAVYAAGGFHPLPFHLTCLALLLLNFLLLYLLLLRLAGMAGVAWVALLFGCFHGQMWSIYTDTGVVFDILCATFYYTAFLLYTEARRFGVLCGMAMLVCTLLALGSKETALSLPAVLLAYEILFHPPKARRDVGAWAVAKVATIGPSVLVCLAFIVGRLTISGPLTGHPAYTPVFTVQRFLETTMAYTRILFDDSVSFTPLTAILFWAGCVVLGALARSRLMVFGIVAFALGMLPMSFMTPRQAGYVFYVPMFGLALYVGAAFALIRDRISESFRWRNAASCWTAVFVCLVVWTHYSEGARPIRNGAGPGGQGAIQLTADWLPRLCPRLAPGSRVLLVDSPFGDETWVPGFTLGLLYHCKDLRVVNARAPQNSASLAGPFDYTFVYKDREVVKLTVKHEQTSSPPSAPTRVRIVNLTTPGATDFHVGETFRLTVMGASGEPVTLMARQNSLPLSDSTYGPTSPNGSLELTGRMASEHIGKWQEQWRVGQAAAATIAFEVKSGARPRVTGR